MSLEAYRAAPVIEVPEGTTATVIEVTLVSDGVAIDLSSATGSVFFHCKTIPGVSVINAGPASFTTDGSDGKVEFILTSTVTDTAPRDLICEFEVQGFNSGNLITYPFTLRINKRAKV